MTRLTQTLILLLLTITCSGQNSSIDTTELKHFWTDCITPLINSDKDALKQVVYFPLAGDWGQMVGLKTEELLLTQQDFFDNFDKLFDKEFKDKLSKLTYKNIDIDERDNGQTELIVTITYQDLVDKIVDESAISLHFYKVDNKWKLFAINGIG